MFYQRFSVGSTSDEPQRVWTTLQVAERLRITLGVRCVISDGHLRASLPRGRKRRSCLLATTAALTLAACGSDSGGTADRGVRIADDVPAGRPLGAPQGQGGVAIDAALRFTRGYLRFSRGLLPAERLPAAAPELRGSLKGQRIPLASRDRRSAVVSADVKRLSVASARVTVTVRNISEGFDYPLPLDLVKRGGRWLVLTIPDDL